MREQALQLVREAVSDLNEELQYPELDGAGEETHLFGAEGGLDSLSLVSLIVDLEHRVGAAFGRQVLLADEKAMSTRNTPYRTVGTLADFIVERVGADP